MAPPPSLLVALLCLGSIQGSEPTIEALRARAQERMRQDRAIRSADDLRTLEELYRSANENLRGSDGRRILLVVAADMLLQSVPPVSASDSSGWRLHANGLGPITVGMTIGEASKVSEVQFEQFGLPPEPATFCTYYRGELVGHVVALRVIEDRIDRIEVSDSGFATLSGVKVGDAIEHVKHVYGGALSVEPHHYLADQGVVLMVLGPYGNGETETGIAFTASSDRGVTAIWVGRYSGIRESEGCS